MIRVTLLSLILLFSLQAFSFTNGQIQNAPYSTALRNLIDYSALNGQHVGRLAKDLWDTNVQGGTTTGTYKLRIKLPKNATVRQTYFYVKTPALGAATTGTTWGVTCGSATLFTAADISTKAAGTYFSGNQTGTAANMSDVGTSDCTVSVVQGVQGYTVSGQVDVIVLYDEHD